MNAAGWDRFPERLGRSIGDWVSPGTLARAHTGLEGLRGCNDCHAGLERTPDTLCLDCHSEVAERIESRAGFHGGVSGPCVDCHAEHLGLEADLLGLDRERFNHEAALFALRGAHTEIACNDCHLLPHPETGRESFLPFPVAHDTCAACHTNPHGEELLAGRDCAHCHGQISFSASGLVRKAASSSSPPFDHARDTRFPLDGMHAGVGCDLCHTPERNAVERARKLPPGRSAPRSCAGCHAVARDLQSGRFAGRQVDPDPHHPKLRCVDCHGRSEDSTRLIAYERECVRCHAPEYAPLLLTRKRRIDELALEVESALRAHELAVQRGEAEAIESTPLVAQVQVLSRSGQHHPELAESLLRELLGRLAEAPEVRP